MKPGQSLLSFSCSSSSSPSSSIIRLLQIWRAEYGPITRTRTSCRLPAILLALLLSGVMAVTAAAEPQITVEPTGASPRVAVRYRGIRLSADGRSAKDAQRDWDEPLFPSTGQPVAWVVKLTAGETARSVRVQGQVTDYVGAALPVKVDFELQAAAGQTAMHEIQIQPTEKDLGPFYLRAQWQETAGPEKGTVTAAAGQANALVVVEDFELVRYAQPGAPLENSPEARRGGEMGLLVRPQVLPEPPKARDAKPPEPRWNAQAVPLSMPLPGRPVQIGLWVKAQGAARLQLVLADPGVEYAQSRRPDRWTIGPIEVLEGDWHRVVFPAPGYGKPKAELRTVCDSGGIVDYPLTIEEIVVESPDGAPVALDDLVVWTQTEPARAVQVRPIVDKPGGLLYRDDIIRVGIANTWLWGAARAVDYVARLTDILGIHKVIAQGRADIAPGGEEVIAGRFDDLPMGSYSLAAEVSTGDQPVASFRSDRPLVVYEPKGQRLPHRELHAVLAGKEALCAELGFREDTFAIPWHAADNHPAAENPQGYFNFTWLDPRVEAKRQAGLEVVGRLGFTALWADPQAAYDRRAGVWYGLANALPGQQVFWEEYVQRTLEHYRGQIDTWIVWDRPDSESFKASPYEFTERILAPVHAVARKINAEVKLVTGGVIREHMEDYIKGLVQSRAGQYIDAVGVIPCTPPLSPEDSYMDVILARVQRLRDREGFKPPLWALNLGWSTGEGEGRITEEDQARYIARAHAICRAYGIERVLHEPYLVPRRDASGYLFEQDGFFGLKPSALAAKTAAAMLDDATFIREVFLQDRRDGLARAYLFRKPDEQLLLAAWRTDGASRLTLPAGVEQVLDLFGNPVPSAVESSALSLLPSPHYVLFPAGHARDLARQLERAAVEYADAPESVWKHGWTFHLDVGDSQEERVAQYSCTEDRLVGPVSSYYHNDYGRQVTDSGRHFKGEERFVVDVSKFGDADLMLRKRINYSVPNQLVEVYCNDQFVGQCFAFKRDRRYHWRNLEFVVPNRFFAGQPAAALRMVARGGEATSYAYWAGPLKQKSLYVSDLSLLAGTSGYGPGVNRDRNILGGPLGFFKQEGKTYEKGLGTHAGRTLDESLIVVPLNKQYRRLQGTVGIDLLANGRGSLRFRVSDGERQLFDSKEMTYFSEPVEMDVDLSDVVVLLLFVEDAGDGSENDLGNWADLRLELK